MRELLKPTKAMDDRLGAWLMLATFLALLWLGTTPGFTGVVAAIGFSAIEAVLMWRGSKGVIR